MPARPNLRILRLCVPGALLVAATGCSTHLFDLTYQPSMLGVERLSTDVRVSVEPFADRRGTDEAWLGAIRGGYGNQLKTLRTNRPTADIVTDAVREALLRRGLLESGVAGNYAVTGSVEKLDCSYYVNREAHAHIVVQVRDRTSGNIEFEKSYQSDQVESGWGAGIFGDPAQLHALAERTTREAIDRALDDPEFLRAIGVTD